MIDESQVSSDMGQRPTAAAVRLFRGLAAWACEVILIQDHFAAAIAAMRPLHLQLRLRQRRSAGAAGEIVLFQYLPRNVGSKILNDVELRMDSRPEHTEETASR